MKHIKHINEMDEWATSNRIGGDIGDDGPPMMVKISPRSYYYREHDACNPKDVVGTVDLFTLNYNIYIMKYLKEMDDWATSNRIGNVKGMITELTDPIVKASLKDGPPIRVKIKTTSKHYGDGLQNPSEVIGTIDIFRGNRDYKVGVQWDNGQHNNYRYEDLDISYIKPNSYNEITRETVTRSIKNGPPMRVKISKTSFSYCDGDVGNPKNVVGTIDKFIGGDIGVQWDNGQHNNYEYRDLEIVIE